MRCTAYGAVFQAEVVRTMALTAHPESPAPLLQGLWMALFSGYQSPAGMDQLSQLLDKGGLASMLNTIFLILTAMTFGGLLDSTGILRQLLDLVLKRRKTDRRPDTGNGGRWDHHQYSGGGSVSRDHLTRAIVYFCVR